MLKLGVSTDDAQTFRNEGIQGHARLLPHAEVIFTSWTWSDVTCCFMKRQNV